MRASVERCTACIAAQQPHMVSRPTTRRPRSRVRQRGTRRGPVAPRPTSTERAVLRIESFNSVIAGTVPAPAQRMPARSGASLRDGGTLAAGCPASLTNALSPRADAPAILLRSGHAPLSASDCRRRYHRGVMSPRLVIDRERRQGVLPTARYRAPRAVRLGSSRRLWPGQRRRCPGGVPARPRTWTQFRQHGARVVRVAAGPSGGPGHPQVPERTDPGTGPAGG